MLCLMIRKQRYIEYLISTPINYTCQNLSEHLDNVSHDVVSNFLKRNRITAREVWALVNGLIKNTPESFLILDDSVQNKQYSKSIELVKRQYSGAMGGLVRGIGVPLYLDSDSLLGQNPRLIIGRMAEEVAFTLRLKACPRD